MRKHKWRVFVGFVLASVLAAMTAGCANKDGGGSSAAENHAEPVFSDGKSVMIAGWVGPDQYDEEQARYVAECGIDTLFILGGAENEAETKAALSALAGAGVSAYITGRKDGSGFEYAGLYRDVENFRGMAYDEPAKEGIDMLVDMTARFAEDASGKTFFVNLLPSSDSNTKVFDGYAGYLEYLREKVLTKEVGEKWLSVDRYPLNATKFGLPSVDTGWLYDLGVTASVGKKYGLKTNFFIQTMPHGVNNRVTPTYETVAYQIYTLLAFGFDGISEYCYQTPPLSHGFEEDEIAMIDRAGARTDFYYAAQKANLEIRKFEHVYQSFDWQGVFSNDGGKTITEKPRRTSNACFMNVPEVLDVAEIASVASVYSSADALFGYFEGDVASEAFMAVNFAPPWEEKSNTIRIAFEPSAKYAYCQVYIGGEKKTATLKDNVLEITLAPGTGAFVVPY